MAEVQHDMSLSLYRQILSIKISKCTNICEPAGSPVADRQSEHVLSLIANAVMYYADHLFNLESVASEKHNIWTLKVRH